MKSKSLSILVCVGLGILAPLAHSEMPATPAQLRALATDVEKTLRQNDIDPWFSRCVDEKRGGFLCNFDQTWIAAPDQPKTIVFQSRMTWVASQIVKRRTDLAAPFEKITRHGANFLCQRMWDKREGGFFWDLTADDQAPPSPQKEKHAYGISFAIYALASAGDALHERQYIEQAAEAFRWLDRHGHDEKNGGYFEAFYRDGTPMLSAPSGHPQKKRDAIWSPLGCKSMNTHIHLLESFTELYRVWPDRRLRSRIEELIQIMQKHVYVLPGMQGMFFLSDWTLLPTTMSYGHDVETAYLLIEASSALGRENDAAIWKMARSLVDQSLKDGWDAKHGGFYDTGNALMGPVGPTEKVWWAQAESLNSLLLMHERYGKETSVYWERFLQQWQFICAHSLDSKYRGWFRTVTEEGAPLETAKGTPWKAAYHSGRALLNVSDRLNRLADRASDNSVSK